MDDAGTNTRTCRLCLLPEELQDSHLLPRAMYKVLRATSEADQGRNPNPLVVTDEAARSTSMQVKTHLLCFDCEQLFNQRGEKWILGNCFQEDGTFPLRDVLANATPINHNGGERIYATSDNPGISTEQLVYFGASVFWRAAVHKWHIPTTSKTVNTNLGPYEDELRRFLRDELPFPQRMAMFVCVSDLSKYLETAMFPEQRVENGYHVHEFVIPGMTFALFVGAKLPPHYAEFCAARSERGCIFVSPHADRKFMQRLVGLRGMHR